MDSDSDSNSNSSSPAPSPSPPQSPDASIDQAPTLDTLVLHFVASKRSLAAANHVWRANQLVTTARTLLEEIAVLNVRNAFAARALHTQLDTLYAIRDTISDASDHASDEFRATIDRLDLANEKLEKTLETLRTTVVDPALQRAPADNDDDDDKNRSDSQQRPIRPDEDEDDTDGPPPKTLYHFIDETRHHDLRASLRSLIDSFNGARAELDNSTQRFNETVQSIADTIAGSTEPDEEPQDLPPPPTLSSTHASFDEDPVPTTPITLFHNMESHAAEMASLLQSLVSHYDLCTTALKHTEGGAQAVQRALQEAGPSPYPTASSPEPNLTPQDTPLPPTERASLLRVLATDAPQVTPAVAELHARGAALQRSATALSSHHCEHARNRNAALRSAHASMRTFRDTGVAPYILAGRGFRGVARRIRGEMRSREEELDALAEFHEGFVSDYAAVRAEVGRRRGAEEAARKIALKAKRELGRVAEVESEAREAFMHDVGRFLPADLWPGMRHEAVRWEVSAVGGGEVEEEGG